VSLTIFRSANSSFQSRFTDSSSESDVIDKQDTKSNKHDTNLMPLAVLPCAIARSTDTQIGVGRAGAWSVQRLLAGLIRAGKGQPTADAQAPATAKASTTAASVTIVDLPAGTTVSGLELFEAVQTVGGVDPVGAIVADANDGGNVSPARSL